jgi:hypothetical protein
MSIHQFLKAYGAFENAQYETAGAGIGVTGLDFRGETPETSEVVIDSSRAMGGTLTFDLRGNGHLKNLSLKPTESDSGPQMEFIKWSLLKLLVMRHQ